MSKIYNSSNLDSDFNSFFAELFTLNNLVITDSEIDKPAIKRFHASVYILSLIALKVKRKNRQIHKYIYLEEIVSSSLAIACQVLQGFILSTDMLYRRIIENFYSHIFYFDHPVEFTLLNNGKNDYTPIMDLKNYLKNHPELVELGDAEIETFNNKIFTSYQDLCKVVHGKGVSFMQLSKNLKEVKFDKSEVNTSLNEYNSDFLGMIYILFKFHRDISFSLVERSIFTRVVSKKYRNTLFS